MTTSTWVTITITKATPTLSVPATSLAANGNPRPANFTITGTNNDNLSSLVRVHLQRLEYRAG